MIVIGKKEKIHRITQLALKLWPDNNYEELKSEILTFIDSYSAAILLFESEDSIVGYSQVSIRNDYVEGSTSSPVGYLEGIYVDEGYRNMGIGKALLLACENWAKEKGCLEFGSDTSLENYNSINFHLKCGFQEAARLVSFIKKI